jgi:hypothetical protein
MTESRDVATPMVSATASFQDNVAEWALHKEPQELGPTQLPALGDTPVIAGDGDFEDVLCQINRDSRRVHIVGSFWKGFS